MFNLMWWIQLVGLVFSRCTFEILAWPRSLMWPPGPYWNFVQHRQRSVPLTTYLSSLKHLVPARVLWPRESRFRLFRYRKRALLRRITKICHGGLRYISNRYICSFWSFVYGPHPIRTTYLITSSHRELSYLIGFRLNMSFPALFALRFTSSFLTFH